MITIAALLAAATLTAGTVPAAPAADVALAAPAKATASRYAVRYDAKRDRYCVLDRQASPVTGSRLVLEQCKTSSDWAERGLTIGRKQ